MSTFSSAPIQRPGIVSLSLQEALWMKLEASASNLTHAQDNGFKKMIVDTKETKVYSTDNTNVSYAQTKSAIDFSQGNLNPTHNEFDIALTGPGFFAFQTKENGVAYSRDGQLSKNKQGVLINILGDPILSTGGSELAIPAEAKFVTITTDGTVTTEKGEIGKIGVKDFIDKENVSKVGRGYLYTAEQVKDIAAPVIKQGFVETSNVNAVGEILNLVEIARLFENAQKMLEDDTKRQSKAINISANNS